MIVRTDLTPSLSQNSTAKRQNKKNNSTAKKTKQNKNK